MTVKHLFDLDLADEVKQRIMRMQPESARQWGTMNSAQALTHCRCGLQMAMGVIQPKRAPFPGNVVGLLIKPLVFGNDRPLRHNTPSAPELFGAPSTACDFERERVLLLATIDSFTAQGAACCSQHPHPFFGRLKPQEWAVLMYKHLDHHLRQFHA